MEISTDKRTEIKDMFGTIAPRYDFLNRLLSLGIDRHWRNAAADKMQCREGGLIIDVATGTGDMALAAAAKTNSTVTIIGVDFCESMVQLAEKKIRKSCYKGRINLGVASCEALPFRNDTFDSASIAFGIRNVINRDLGLRELWRVLRPGGRLIVLEFSNPRSKLFRFVYHIYFRKVLPAIGGIFSDSCAYSYLPDSVLEFPEQEGFKNILVESGFENISHSDLSFGIATVYIAEKPAIPS